MPAIIPIFSYSVAASAFLLLLILLLTKWRGRRHGAVLVCACFATLAWASSVVYFTAKSTPLAFPINLLEIAKNAVWTIFLLDLLRQRHSTHALPGFVRNRQAMAYIVAYFVLFFSSILRQYNPTMLSSAIGFISGSFGYICMSVMGLLLIEQLFRNASSKERWSIKFACLGIGGLFAYDFYLFVDALLFRQIDPNIWTARGLVIATAAPLIAISAARSPDWSVGISVSRRVLFHSVTLIGASLYLLLVSAAGYYVRFFGGDWGTVLQTTLLSVATLTLFSILFSGAFRSWLKVSISKNFYSYGYDYREEWIKFTNMLSVDGPKLGEHVVRSIAELVESPKGILYTKNNVDEYVATADWNLAWRGIPEPADGSLCTFLKNKYWIIDIQEYEVSPEKYDELILPSWLRLFPQAGLIVPLVQNTKLLGFVVLSRPRSKIKLDWEVTDLLKIVGAQAANYLARQESVDALAVARQFETFNRMSTFVAHDLKNLVSQLSLLLNNAEKHKNSPEFQQDMLATIDNSVQKMRVLLQRFNRESSIEKSGRVPLNGLLEKLTIPKIMGEPRPFFEPTIYNLVVIADAARLERVVGHLIQNAIEATPKNGRVVVKLSAQHDCAIIEISDTGHGMTEEFIQSRLFKPFESTKAAGMGIGVFETREYVQELGGRLDVNSQLSIGTTFRISLPLYENETHAFASTENGVPREI